MRVEFTHIRWVDPKDIIMVPGADSEQRSFYSDIFGNNITVRWIRVKVYDEKDGRILSSFDSIRYLLENEPYWIFAIIKENGRFVDINRVEYFNKEEADKGHYFYESKYKEWDRDFKINDILGISDKS